MKRVERFHFMVKFGIRGCNFALTSADLEQTSTSSRYPKVSTTGANRMRFVKRDDLATAAEEATTPI
jgi:hypothetical protein